MCGGRMVEGMDVRPIMKRGQKSALLRVSV